MKRYTKIVSLFLLLGIGMTTMQSCYGKFALTRKIYTWNGSVTDNKFINNFVFWAFNIIPVYGIGGMVDGVILNLIEFWTGTNPMAMNEGQKETKQFAFEGKTYEMTVTKNQMVVTGVGNDYNARFVYQEASKAWYMESGDRAVKIAQIINDNEAQFIVPSAAR